MEAKLKSIDLEERRMRANNLSQVLNLFNPKRPLLTKEEVDNYFVERPLGPLKMMGDYLLQSRAEPSKILFTGHRGSGKSTELNKLVLNLHEEFFMLKFSIAETLDLFDLDYIDVVLTSGLKLLEKAVREKVKINEKILEDIFDWLHYDITEEKIIELTKEASLSSNVNALVLNLEGKLSKESATRKIMRERIKPRFSELINKINLAITEIQEKTSKKVLIIIEDIDKTNLEIAQQLFFQQGASLLSINSKIIYTFPISLRYSDNFTQVAKTFDAHFVLPNVTIFTRQGKENPIGQEMMREVILKRMEESLISEDAIREAIQLSGGLLIELMTIIRNASLYTLSSKGEVIDVANIHKAANDIRNDYRVMLREDQYQLLKKIKEDKEKRVFNDEIVRQLLHNLSLLEYRNDDFWVDVHPIVKPLL